MIHAAAPQRLKIASVLQRVVLCALMVRPVAVDAIVVVVRGLVTRLQGGWVRHEADKSFLNDQDQAHCTHKITAGNACPPFLAFECSD
jgi:hypothetical protein